MNDAIQIELVESPRKRLQRAVSDVKFWTLGKLSRMLLNNREMMELERVRTFCCFVGHGRSGGSLVGALLNAHPNVVMSNELNALRRLRHGLRAPQLFRLICLISRRQAKHGSRGGGGYTYQVLGQWQGKYREVLVIGDRKAGATAYELATYPQTLPSLLRAMNVEIRFIHVVRHPLDKIATTFQKTLSKPGESAESHLRREIANYLARSRVVLELERAIGTSRLLHLHHERLIQSPSEQLSRLCDYLGVAASTDYIKDCARILIKSPRETRHGVTWSNDLLQLVRGATESFPWLAEYADEM
jgi:hypothetical protein